ncbi:hypothetical protein Bca52824_076681 [Brassica carinata]|uniref:DUF220 domain-containing protein n=3 Tax=Brassica TaxID=3705 RepID=A0A0D3DR35_BRAOL|nr:hypothetical protein Bca52824_076681 [Brassica carinata]
MHGLGKMCSSGTGSPLVAKDDELPENPIGEEEESLERNSTEENDSGDEAATASAVNPLSSDAAQIVPLLQNLLLNNDIQRERLTGLFQLFAPAADTNANVNTEEDEQTAREAALSSQVHFLEQSVQMLEEEVENQKKLNAQWILVKGFTGIGCGKRETRLESNVRPILRTCFNVERGGCLPQTISLTFYFPSSVIFHLALFWVALKFQDQSRRQVLVLFNMFQNKDVFPGFVVWINQTIREPLKAEFKRLKNVKEENLVKSLKAEIETTHDKHRDEEKLEKQLQAWRNNPSWIDQPPKVQVKTQNGSFCHLNVEVNVGLPPESVYNIFTHPDNKRYFKNIKECISRKVLTEEGPMQTVDVKQAAAWKFLWWAGTFPVHLIVQENRKNLTSKYKQEKTMFMKVFEGCWRVEPLFIDEHLCDRMKPKTLQDYDSCSNGRGRIGSKVTMDQMFQPSAILTPPPLSWYIRGITIKTTESMIEDLLAEAARLRGGGGGGGHDDDGQGENGAVLEKSKDEHIKERWRSRRRSKGMRYTNRRMM